MIEGVRAPLLTPLAAAVLHVPQPERALAIEAGDAEATLFLAREFPAARVRGVASPAERVRQASARVGLDPEGRVAFKAGRPGRLPFPDGFFDLVVQLEGRVVPGEIARVLRDDGHLVLIDARPDRFTGPSRRRLLLARLRRHGIVTVESAGSGDGNFLVGRRDLTRSSEPRI
jgi:SAM-dependent methyltransferase